MSTPVFARFRFVFVAVLIKKVVKEQTCNVIICIMAQRTIQKTH